MIDPECFVLAKALGIEDGDLIGWFDKRLQRIRWGTVIRVWLGVEEVIDVRASDSQLMVHVHPTLTTIYPPIRWVPPVPPIQWAA